MTSSPVILEEENPYFIEGLQDFLMYGSDITAAELALISINSGLEVEPDSISGWAYKASLLHNMKMYDEAVKSWKQALKFTRLEYPEHDDYYMILMLTSSLDECGRFDESYDICEQKLKTCTGDFWPISLLQANIPIALRRKKYDVVVEYSKRLMDMLLVQTPDGFGTSDDMCDALRSWSYALFLSHKFDEAEIKTNDALQYYPNDESLVTCMGKILIAQKKYQKAIPFFEKSLVFNSKNDVVWFEMAKAYDGLNNIQRVLDCLLIAFSLNPTYKKNILEHKIFSKLKDNTEFQRIFNLSP
jgi:tetratricopeptide (TPR) repeat protein